MAVFLAVFPACGTTEDRAEGTHEDVEEMRTDIGTARGRQSGKIATPVITGAWAIRGPPQAWAASPLAHPTNTLAEANGQFSNALTL